MLDDGSEGERSRLAEPAEGGELEDIGQLAQAGQGGRRSGAAGEAVENGQEADGPLAAGRALAARLLGVEGEEGPHRVGQVDGVVEDDHAVIAQAICSGNHRRARSLMEEHVLHIVQVLEADGLDPADVVEWV